MSRVRLWRLLLLLLAGAAFGADAAALSRRNHSDPLDLSRAGIELYYVAEKGFYCQMCPPGTYLAEYCEEQNGSSKCFPCKDEEYMEAPNSLHSCYECSKCREDQVELSPCQATRNTECACKQGTFCAPNQPCEMCQKCRPRCPEAQVVLSPCTPYRDTQCGPATGTSLFYFWIVLAVVIVVALVGACLLRKYWCCCPGNGRNLSTSYNVKNYVMQRLLPYRRVNVGTRDNERNEQHSHNQPLPGPGESEVMLPTAPPASVRPRRNLVPQPDKDPVLALRGTFYVFAELLPCKHWKKFGRSLDLLENDLPLQQTQDEFYEMLQKWMEREGSRSSVNTLLDTLDQLNLSGVADSISSELIKRGSFRLEMS